MQTYKVVQIGCGVVGQAYIKAYKKIGCNVVGIEKSLDIIERLKQDVEMYHVSDDMSLIKNVDFVMISICTPLKEDKLDLTYLFSSVENVAQIIKNNPDAMVVIRSTVPPKTTRIYKEQLQKIVACNVHVMYQPEFLRAVSAFEDAMNPWHILFGIDKGADLSKMINLYSKFIEKDKIHERLSIMNIEDAELLKIVHNSFNAAKISFTNQCFLLCEQISKKLENPVDIHTIMQTVVKTCEGYKNPRYGTLPGHPYNGECLPKDSAELAHLEKEYGLSVQFFNSIVQVNNLMKKDYEKIEVLPDEFHMSFEKLKI